MTPINPGAFRFDPLGLDEASFKRSIANRLVYSVGKDAYTAKPRDWYSSLAYSLRDRLMERWMETMRSYYRQDAKRVYYLSLEFLIGRTLVNSVLNMDVEEETRGALLSMGLDMGELRNQEPDAALGNGGLGRLAGPDHPADLQGHRIHGDQAHGEPLAGAGRLHLLASVSLA